MPKESIEWEKEQFGEKLHEWYLEAVKTLKPESFNPNANKPYSEMTDEQKFIDSYIADKVLSHFHHQIASAVEARETQIREMLEERYCLSNARAKTEIARTVDGF